MGASSLIRKAPVRADSEDTGGINQNSTTAAHNHGLAMVPSTSSSTAAVLSAALVQTQAPSTHLLAAAPAFAVGPNSRVACVATATAAACSDSFVRLNDPRTTPSMKLFPENEGEEQRTGGPQVQQQSQQQVCYEQQQREVSLAYSRQGSQQQQQPDGTISLEKATARNELSTLADFGKSTITGLVPGSLRNTGSQWHFPPASEAALQYRVGAKVAAPTTAATPLYKGALRAGTAPLPTLVENTCVDGKRNSPARVAMESATNPGSSATAPLCESTKSTVDPHIQENAANGALCMATASDKERTSFGFEEPDTVRAWDKNAKMTKLRANRRKKGPRKQWRRKTEGSGASIVAANPTDLVGVLSQDTPVHDKQRETATSAASVVAKTSVNASSSQGQPESGSVAAACAAILEKESTKAARPAISAPNANTTTPAEIKMERAVLEPTALLTSGDHVEAGYRQSDEAVGLPEGYYLDQGTPLDCRQESYASVSSSSCCCYPDVERGDSLMRRDTQSSAGGGWTGRGTDGWCSSSFRLGLSGTADTSMAGSWGTKSSVGGASMDYACRRRSSSQNYALPVACITFYSDAYYVDNKGAASAASRRDSSCLQDKRTNEPRCFTSLHSPSSSLVGPPARTYEGGEEVPTGEENIKEPADASNGTFTNVLGRGSPTAWERSRSNSVFLPMPRGSVPRVEEAEAPPEGAGRTGGLPVTETGSVEASAAVPLVGLFERTEPNVVSGVDEGKVLSISRPAGDIIPKSPAGTVRPVVVEVAEASGETTPGEEKQQAGENTDWTAENYALFTSLSRDASTTFLASENLAAYLDRPQNKGCKGEPPESVSIAPSCLVVRRPKIPLHAMDVDKHATDPLSNVAAASVLFRLPAAFESASAPRGTTMLQAAMDTYLSTAAAALQAPTVGVNSGPACPTAACLPTAAAPLVPAVGISGCRPCLAAALPSTAGALPAQRLGALDLRCPSAAATPHLATRAASAALFVPAKRASDAAGDLRQVEVAAGPGSTCPAAAAANVTLLAAAIAADSGTGAVAAGAGSSWSVANRRTAGINDTTSEGASSRWLLRNAEPGQGHGLEPEYLHLAEPYGGLFLPIVEQSKTPACCLITAQEDQTEELQQSHSSCGLSLLHALKQPQNENDECRKFPQEQSGELVTLQQWQQLQDVERGCEAARHCLNACVRSAAEATSAAAYYPCSFDTSKTIIGTRGGRVPNVQEIQRRQSRKYLHEVRSQDAEKQPTNGQLREKQQQQEHQTSGTHHTQLACFQGSLDLLQQHQEPSLQLGHHFQKQMQPLPSSDSHPLRQRSCSIDVGPCAALHGIGVGRRYTVATTDHQLRAPNKRSQPQQQNCRRRLEVPLQQQQQVLVPRNPRHHCVQQQQQGLIKEQQPYIQQQNLLSEEQQQAAVQKQQLLLSGTRHPYIQQQQMLLEKQQRSTQQQLLYMRQPYTEQQRLLFYVQQPYTNQQRVLLEDQEACMPHQQRSREGQHYVDQQRELLEQQENQENNVKPHVSYYEQQRVDCGFEETWPNQEKTLIQCAEGSFLGGCEVKLFWGQSADWQGESVNLQEQYSETHAHLLTESPEQHMGPECEWYQGVQDPPLQQQSNDCQQLIVKKPRPMEEEKHCVVENNICSNRQTSRKQCGTRWLRCALRYVWKVLCRVHAQQQQQIRQQQRAAHLVRHEEEWQLLQENTTRVWEPTSFTASTGILSNSAAGGNVYKYARERQRSLCICAGSTEEERERLVAVAGLPCHPVVRMRQMPSVVGFISAVSGEDREATDEQYKNVAAASATNSSSNIPLAASAADKTAALARVHNALPNSGVDTSSLARQQLLAAAAAVLPRFYSEASRISAGSFAIWSAASKSGELTRTCQAQMKNSKGQYMGQQLQKVAPPTTSSSEYKNVGTGNNAISNSSNMKPLSSLNRCASSRDGRALATCNNRILLGSGNHYSCASTRDAPEGGKINVISLPTCGVSNSSSGSADSSGSASGNSSSGDSHSSGFVAVNNRHNQFVTFGKGSTSQSCISSHNVNLETEQKPCGVGDFLLRALPLLAYVTNPGPGNLHAARLVGPPPEAAAVNSAVVPLAILADLQTDNNRCTSSSGSCSSRCTGGISSSSSSSSVYERRRKKFSAGTALCIARSSNGEGHYFERPECLRGYEATSSQRILMRGGISKQISLSECFGVQTPLLPQLQQHVNSCEKTTSLQLLGKNREESRLHEEPRLTLQQAAVCITQPHQRTCTKHEQPCICSGHAGEVALLALPPRRRHSGICLEAAVSSLPDNATTTYNALTAALADSATQRTAVLPPNTSPQGMGGLIQYRGIAHMGPAVTLERSALSTDLSGVCVSASVPHGIHTDGFSSTAIVRPVDCTDLASTLSSNHCEIGIFATADIESSAVASFPFGESDSARAHLAGGAPLRRFAVKSGPTEAAAVCSTTHKAAIRAGRTSQFDSAAMDCDKEGFMTLAWTLTERVGYTIQKLSHLNALSQFLCSAAVCWTRNCYYSTDGRRRRGLPWQARQTPSSLSSQRRSCAPGPAWVSESLAEAAQAGRTAAEASHRHGKRAPAPVQPAESEISTATAAAVAGTVHAEPVGTQRHEGKRSSLVQKTTEAADKLLPKQQQMAGLTVIMRKASSEAGCEVLPAPGATLLGNFTTDAAGAAGTAAITGIASAEKLAAIRRPPPYSSLLCGGGGGTALLQRGMTGEGESVGDSSWSDGDAIREAFVVESKETAARADPELSDTATLYTTKKEETPDAVVDEISNAAECVKATDHVTWATTKTTKSGQGVICQECASKRKKNTPAELGDIYDLFRLVPKLYRAHAPAFALLLHDSALSSLFPLHSEEVAAFASLMLQQPKPLAAMLHRWLAPQCCSCCKCCTCCCTCCCCCGRSGNILRPQQCVATACGSCQTIADDAQQQLLMQHQQQRVGPLQPLQQMLSQNHHEQRQVLSQSMHDNPGQQRALHLPFRMRGDQQVALTYFDKASLCGKGLPQQDVRTHQQSYASSRYVHHRPANHVALVENAYYTDNHRGLCTCSKTGLVSTPEVAGQSSTELNAGTTQTYMRTLGGENVLVLEPPSTARTSYHVQSHSGVAYWEPSITHQQPVADTRRLQQQVRCQHEGLSHQNYMHEQLQHCRQRSMLSDEQRHQQHREPVGRKAPIEEQAAATLKKGGVWRSYQNERRSTRATVSSCCIAGPRLHQQQRRHTETVTHKSSMPEPPGAATAVQMCDSCGEKYLQLADTARRTTQEKSFLLKPEGPLREPPFHEHFKEPQLSAGVDQYPLQACVNTLEPQQEQQQPQMTAVQWENLRWPMNIKRQSEPGLHAEERETSHCHVFRQRSLSDVAQNCQSSLWCSQGPMRPSHKQEQYALQLKSNALHTEAQPLREVVAATPYHGAPTSVQTRYFPREQPGGVTTTPSNLVTPGNVHSSDAGVTGRAVEDFVPVTTQGEATRGAVSSVTGTAVPADMEKTSAQQPSGDRLLSCGINRPEGEARLLFQKETTGISTSNHSASLEDRRVQHIEQPSYVAAASSTKSVGRDSYICSSNINPAFGTACPPAVCSSCSSSASSCAIDANRHPPQREACPPATATREGLYRDQQSFSWETSSSSSIDKRCYASHSRASGTGDSSGGTNNDISRSSASTAGYFHSNVGKCGTKVWGSGNTGEGCSCTRVHINTHMDNGTCNEGATERGSNVCQSSVEGCSRDGGRSGDCATSNLWDAFAPDKAADPFLQKLCDMFVGTVGAPAVDVYVRRLQELSRLGAHEALMALLLLSRVMARHPYLPFCTWNAHRLLLAAFLIITKTVSDRFYNNGVWARFGGVKVTELNRLEKAFLILIDHRCFLSLEQFAAGFTLLKRVRCVLPAHLPERQRHAGAASTQLYAAGHQKCLRRSGNTGVNGAFQQPVHGGGYEAPSRQPQQPQNGAPLRPEQGHHQIWNQQQQPSYCLGENDVQGQVLESFQGTEERVLISNSRNTTVVVKGVRTESENSGVTHFSNGPHAGPGAGSMSIPAALRGTRYGASLASVETGSTPKPDSMDACIHSSSHISALSKKATTSGKGGVDCFVLEQSTQQCSRRDSIMRSAPGALREARSAKCSEQHSTVAFMYDMRSNMHDTGAQLEDNSSTKFFDRTRIRQQNANGTTVPNISGDAASVTCSFPQSHGCGTVGIFGSRHTCRGSSTGRSNDTSWVNSTTTQTHEEGNHATFVRTNTQKVGCGNRGCRRCGEPIEGWSGLAEDEEPDVAEKHAANPEAYRHLLLLRRMPFFALLQQHKELRQSRDQSLQRRVHKRQRCHQVRSAAELQSIQMNCSFIETASPGEIAGTSRRILGTEQESAYSAVELEKNENVALHPCSHSTRNIRERAERYRQEANDAEKEIGSMEVPGRAGEISGNSLRWRPRDEWSASDTSLSFSANDSEDDISVDPVVEEAAAEMKEQLRADDGLGCASLRQPQIKAWLDVVGNPFANLLFCMYPALQRAARQLHESECRTFPA